MKSQRAHCVINLDRRRGAHVEANNVRLDFWFSHAAIQQRLVRNGVKLQCIDKQFECCIVQHTFTLEKSWIKSPLFLSSKRIPRCISVSWVISPSPPPGCLFGLSLCIDVPWREGPGSLSAGVLFHHSCGQQKSSRHCQMVCDIWATSELTINVTCFTYSKVAKGSSVAGLIITGKPERFASVSAFSIMCADIGPNIVSAGASTESIEGTGPPMLFWRRSTRQSCS